MITLNGIELPYDLNWIDRFWEPVITTEKTYSLSGNIIITQRLRATGRPITLGGTPQSAWITKGVIEQIKALAAVPDNEMTLIIYGDTFTVKFDSSSGDAIEISDLLVFHPDPDSEWKYQITLKFLTC
jgi:hypothetical protein